MKLKTGLAIDGKARALFDGKRMQEIDGYIVATRVIDAPTDEEVAIAEAAERLYADELREFRATRNATMRQGE